MMKNALFRDTGKAINFMKDLRIKLTFLRELVLITQAGLFRIAKTLISLFTGSNEKETVYTYRKNFKLKKKNTFCRNKFSSL